jgi:hypothetical protein
MTADEISVQVVDVLNAHGVPYMLVGSLSTNFHAVPRSTKDADVVVQANLAATARLLADELDFLKLDPQFGFESVTATRKLILRSTAGDGFIVELFGLSDDPHDQARFARRLQVNWEGRPTWIVTAEDAIVTKLRWSAFVGREKDALDARSVIAVQGDALDWPYIESWCDRHGSRPLLEQIRAQLRRD